MTNIETDLNSEYFSYAVLEELKTQIDIYSSDKDISKAKYFSELLGIKNPTHFLNKININTLDRHLSSLEFFTIIKHIGPKYSYPVVSILSRELGYNLNLIISSDMKVDNYKDVLIEMTLNANIYAKSLNEALSDGKIDKLELILLNGQISLLKSQLAALESQVEIYKEKY